MSAFARFRGWLAGQWRKAGRLGKVALVTVPLMFGCCFLSLALALVSPDDTPGAEPTAAEQAVATRAESTATDEPAARPTARPTLPLTIRPVRPSATATDPPTIAPTATTRPTNTPRPTRTLRPTTTARPKITTVPAATHAVATRPPATSTRPPLPTATAVRVATIALPTATPMPPPPAPTATLAPANCDPSYPDVCIAPPPPDLDCKDVPYRRFRVVGSDPHRFDGDGNGIGCESD